MLTTAPAVEVPAEHLLLTERDLEILFHLLHTRVLTAEQIFYLVEDREPTSPGQITRRCSRLAAAGYLTTQRTAHGSLYFLGAGGLAVLAGRRRVSESKLRAARGVRAKPANKLEHWVEANTLYLTLILALRTQSRYELTDWQVEPRPSGTRVWPDGVARCRDLRQELGRDVVGLLFDWDRSTERGRGGSPDSHPLNLRFQRTWLDLKTGRLRAVYDLPPTAPLRVCYVTPSYERRNNLARMARRADDWQKGSAFFRFACAHDFDHTTPRGRRAFLGAIWRTPKSPEPCALFD